MLTISWLDSFSVSSGGLELWSESRIGNGIVARRGLGSMRPPELSTRMICWRDGAVSDSNLDPDKAGARLSRIVMFERGGLKGRFVSVLMTRCEASRWVRADMTWVALKAGFSGTYSFSACISHKGEIEVRTRMAPNLNRA